MSVWSDGYTNDIGYTYGYYGELNPISLQIPFLMSGLALPKITTACELGFGQGLSVNAHSAATETKWFGTDFNPAHVSFAQEIANVSGANVELFDQAFNEFCQRDDLPDFEFIGIHGIWSWISDENRDILIDFIRRKLKVGGVLYISYNTLPGWSLAAPIRHMMTEHAHIMGALGEGSIQRVQNSIGFTKDLFSLCHSYQQQAPSVTQRIESISEQNPQYLAHEYFNRDWHPMYFSEMAECLSAAKINYACSANFLEDFKPLNFTQEQAEFLGKIPDPLFAQSTKDYMLNKQFRKDYWVKGARQLSELEHEHIWLKLRFIMTAKKEAIKLDLQGAVGSVDLLPEVYEPILDVLSDHAIHTVASIQEATAKHNINNVLLFESLAILYSKGDISLVQDDEAIGLAKEKCQKINAHILETSLVSNDISHLVSPVTGGAVHLGRMNQLFLYNYIQGEKDKAVWVENVWQALEKIGHRLIKDGKTLETKQENIAELNHLAKTFEDEIIPFVKMTQIIDI